jgi:hypothetical protein
VQRSLRIIQLDVKNSDNEGGVDFVKTIDITLYNYEQLTLTVQLN